MRVRAAEIAERLANSAEQVAAMLLPGGKRQGKFWTAGDTGGSEGESLKVYLVGPKAGRWQDYATGDHGDLLDLWSVTQGKDISDSMADAADWLGIVTDEIHKPNRQYTQPKPKLTALTAAHQNWLGSRMLESEPVERFRIQSEGDWLAFCYYDPAGNLFAIKYRTEDKRMRSAPDCKPGLYGWQSIPENARKVAIVEGELDAVALTQYGMATLSVPNGGGGNGKQSGWIEEEFDNLARFDVIYLALDTDEPGQQAAEEIMGRLGQDRCRLVKLPRKDANDCLMDGVSVDEVREAFNAAKCVDPEELRRPTEFTDQVIQEFHGEPANQVGFGPPFKSMQEELRFRGEEVVVIAGPNGSGKSQFAGHLMLEAMSDEFRVCVASMEMRPRRYLARMIRQATALREPSEGFIRHAMDWMNDRLWVFDLVGTAKTERMLEVFRYARSRYNVRVFLIDNLAKCGIAEDDYNGQKNFVDRLTDFAKETGTTVILVHHMRKGGGDKDDVKGSGAITDMVDTVLIVWRNKAKEDALKLNPEDPEWINAVDGAIRCRKQRNGETEPGKGIWFDRDTFQFLGGLEQKPWRYCSDYRAAAINQ